MIKYLSPILVATLLTACGEAEYIGAQANLVDDYGNPIYVGNNTQPIYVDYNTSLYTYTFNGELANTTIYNNQHLNLVVSGNNNLIRMPDNTTLDYISISGSHNTVLVGNNSYIRQWASLGGLQNRLEFTYNARINAIEVKNDDNQLKIGNNSQISNNNSIHVYHQNHDICYPGNIFVSYFNGAQYNNTKLYPINSCNF